MQPIIKLTRWREFLEFTFALTLFGSLAAHEVYDATLDWRVLAALVGNLGAVAYAFMINDIEDAPDDRQDPARAKRNPVASDELSVGTAWTAALVVAAVTVVAYFLCGTIPFMLGMLTLALAHFYSWKPVRLKARPIVDIVSHALFLSTLLFLVPFYIYADQIGILWVAAVGTFLISANGQLYNQVRDYEMDRTAGLQNTASVLGKTLTDRLAQATIIGSAVSLLVTILQGVFPLWLGIVLVVVGPIVLFVFRHNTTDMRGSETEDAWGQVQHQVLMIGYLTLIAWLIVALA